MAHDQLSGVVVPVITPVDDQDCVDEESFRSLLRRLVAAKVHVLFIGGSAGEGPLLSGAEWVRMMEIACDEVGDAIPLLGGVMETSTSRVLEKVKLLRSIGYSNYVVTPTFYFSLKSADEHLRLFGACKEHDGGMQMIPYNIPGVVHCEIPVDTLCEMARRGWMTTLKESSGNLDYFRRVVAAGAPLGLRAFMGDELGIVEGLMGGAVGVVPVCANFAPEPFIEAYQAGVKKDEAALKIAFEKILMVRKELPLAGTFWVSGIKYALSCVGIGSGLPVSPMEPLNAAQQARVAAFVKQYSESGGASL